MSQTITFGNSQFHTSVSVPGTCGELVQGWHPNWNKPVLISCPIDRSSRVCVSVHDTPGLFIPGAESGAFAKLRWAARLALEYLGQPNKGVTIRVDSQLLSGRGMASSTADVVGGMAALATALNKTLSPAKLAGLACQIEPSDSTMFAGLTMLAYRDNGQFEALGPAPALPLLMLDPGLIVDTLKFNTGLNISALKKLGATTQTAIELLRHGITRNDCPAVGAAATLSATRYQSISENPLLPQAQRWADETGAIGLVRAHSGSLIGLLYPKDTLLEAPEKWLKARFSGQITATKLASGGCRRRHNSVAGHTSTSISIPEGIQ